MDPYSQFFGSGGISGTSTSDTGMVSLGGVSFGSTDANTQIILFGALILGLLYIVGRK